MSASPGRAMDGYPVPPATMTDLYELTMAAGYWKLGRLDEEAIFTLFFRHAPFGGGFTLAAGPRGRDRVHRALRASRPTELAHLEGLLGNDDKPLFEPAFLDYLGDLRLRVDVDAMPEGTARLPARAAAAGDGSPAPGAAARERAAQPRELPDARGDQGGARRRSPPAGRRCMEFGLRRAQGPDGGLTASRAAYLGGCNATSNVLAGRLFGIPVRGTHAHSLGAVVRERAGGVRRLGRRHARQRRAAGRHLRHGGRHRERDRRPARGCASAARSWPASGSTRATSPTSRCGRASCSTRPGSRTPRSSPRTTSTRPRSSPSRPRAPGSTAGASGRSWSRATTSPRWAACTS